jgi:hypothetical protein
MTIRLGKEFKWHMAGVCMLLLGIAIGYVTGGDDAPVELVDHAAAAPFDQPVLENTLHDITPDGDFAPLYLTSTEATSATGLAGG